MPVPLGVHYGYASAALRGAGRGGDAGGTATHYEDVVLEATHR